MDNFKSTWKFMLAMMLIMQAGIFYDYWGDFSDNTWAVHVHYWLATLWFLLLIGQPLLVARGAIDSHRTLGMIGFFVAGAVAFTSISQLNRDLVYANFVQSNPGGIGPFEPWFFIGIALCEIILISVFIFAVLMAIVRRKNVTDHAWWLLSTSFILIMPALARGLQAIWINVYGFEPHTTIVVMPPIYLSQVIIILLNLVLAIKLKVLTHPATYTSISANAMVFLMEPMGRSELLETILRTVIKVS